MKTLALAALALTLATSNVLAFNPQRDPPQSTQSPTNVVNPGQEVGNPATEPAGR